MTNIRDNRDGKKKSPWDSHTGVDIYLRLLLSSAFGFWGWIAIAETWFGLGTRGLLLVRLLTGLWFLRFNPGSLLDLDQ